MRRLGMFASLINVALVLGCVLPVVYVFAMIQYGGITLPYWDHIASAQYIIKYFDGNLTFADLVASHNEARPLFPRLVLLFNAAMTDWDVRSEYVYIYLTIYGALWVLLAALKRLAGGWSATATLVPALFICIVALSPVGAADQDWSLMLLATMCFLFTIAALLLVSFAPTSWPANLQAAGAAWIATWSVSQGILIFPAIIVLQQLIATPRYRVNRWSMFWVLNLVICLALYIPGSFLGQGVVPAITDFLAFIPVYTGSVLGSLLWFPAMGVVWLPETSIINAACGILTLGFCAYTGWRAWPGLRYKRPETLLFFSFAGYALLCALMTALGRANGPYAVATANSSRYSVFAAIFLFALLFYYAPKFARGELVFTIWHRVAAGLFVIASVVTYVRAIPVYTASHDENTWLADAYAAHGQPTDVDDRMYPNPEVFRKTRAALFRLGIGPYRASETTVPIFAGSFAAGAALTPCATVTQRFMTAHDYMRSITVDVVTWAKAPSRYPVLWTVKGLHDGKLLGQGRFSTGSLSDWQPVTLKLTRFPEGREVAVTFSVSCDEQIENPVGLPIYGSATDQANPVSLDGNARAGGGFLGLRVQYAL